MLTMVLACVKATAQVITPEVAAVVEQRQEARIQPCERPDAENEREHQEGARSEGLRPKNAPLVGLVTS